MTNLVAVELNAWDASNLNSSYIEPLYILKTGKSMNAKFGVVVIAVLIAAAAVMTTASAWSDPTGGNRAEKAPVVVSGGNNIYVVWGTDKGTPNKIGELMFRVSTDGGKTFSDKINLSNSTNADAIDQMIDVDENLIAVTWWEHNQTANVPVMRISTDNGKTFGSILKLATNGTIDSPSSSGGGEG